MNLTTVGICFAIGLCLSNINNNVHYEQTQRVLFVFILKNFFGGFLWQILCRILIEYFQSQDKGTRRILYHKSQLIKSLKINKLRIKDKMVKVVNEQIDKFIAQEKEKRYKEMIHSINREKKRRRLKRV